MKKVKIITVILAVALAVTGVSVYAANSWEKRRRGPASNLNLTEEQQKIISEMFIEDLDEMVDSGDLSQEQYDIIADMIQNGFRGGRGQGMPEPKMNEEKRAEMLEKFKEEQAGKLASGEITQEEYDELIENADKRGFGMGKRPEMPEGEEGPSGDKKPFKGMPGRGMHGKGKPMDEVSEQE